MVVTPSDEIDQEEEQLDGEDGRRFGGFAKTVSY